MKSMKFQKLVKKFSYHEKSFGKNPTSLAETLLTLLRKTMVNLLILPEEKEEEEEMKG
jgi:hypothetical protein